MKLLIKFPTRNRCSKFFSTLDKYVELLSDIQNTKFLITLDNDDSSINNTETLERLRKYENLDFFFGDSYSKISAVNRDLDKIDYDWDILLLASDDMIPQIMAYDVFIRHAMISNFPDTDGVLWFNDGFQEKKLNTLSIMGRKYFERFNYIYYPEYKSIFCDNDFMDVANILKRQVYFEKCIIQHEHPDWGYGPSDKVHENNRKDWLHDNGIYNKRKSNNFFLPTEDQKFTEYLKSM
jgi:hypothetical protein